MSPDQAAELLQIPERGLELLRRFNEEAAIKDAISAVQAGFTPSDVAAMYELPYSGEVRVDDEVSEGDIYVYECQTSKCRQRGRVATCSIGPDPDWDDPEEVKPPPNCPGCGHMMHFLKAIEDEEDIYDLKRTYVPKARLKDPLARTDRAGADKDDVDDD